MVLQNVSRSRIAWPHSQTSYRCPCGMGGNGIDLSQRPPIKIQTQNKCRQAKFEKKIGEPILQGSDDASIGKMLPLFRRRNTFLSTIGRHQPNDTTSHPRSLKISVHRPPASLGKIMPNKIADSNTVASKFVQYLKQKLHFRQKNYNV